MTVARAHLVNTSEAGFYHVMSRCVRRALLCGWDPVTHRDCAHRKAWLERRILQLAQVFALDIWAYAVMSNHYHIVLRLDPPRVAKWSHETVARRWLLLCSGPGDSDPNDHKGAVSRLLGNPERIGVLRERLGSLSWFMRFINEPMARFANGEDGCTGRFWEGRFTSQALLDESAVLTCMAYVDLNPVRAGVSRSVEDSPHTSIRVRVRALKEKSPPRVRDELLAPIGVQAHHNSSGIPLTQYLALLDWTGRAIREDKPGVIPAAAPPLLSRLGLQEDAWVSHVTHYGRLYYRALGHVARLKAFAKRLGQDWLKGVTAAAALYK